MIEVTGNLWTYPADVRVITTNGTIKNNGECVMGRGCALEATKLIPGIAKGLGRLIKDHGNHCHILTKDGDFGKGTWLVSFPVKHNWYEPADINLIRRSAEELIDLIDPIYPNDEGHVIVLPRPGCGNGRLLWEDVSRTLELILDDRFHVITYE